MQPGLSQRMQGVQTPIIPVVAQLIRENPGTISLGQGVVGYGPPPQAMARLQDFFTQPDNHKYKPVQGSPELVNAIRKKLREENNIEAEPERIFVTAGGNMAFLNAILAIADPGDEVILQTPYYFNHEMAVTMASARPVLVNTNAEYQLDIAAIERAITERTRAIVTISPNNPTGAVYSEADLRAVNELCAEREVYHIHDEAYEYFVWDDATHFSPGNIEGAGAHTISLYSLSKGYGFASWRIGYMIVPGQLCEAVRKIQDTNIICAPVISQYAAVGALEAGCAYRIEKMMPIVSNRGLLQNAFAELQDIIEVPPAAGAFYFLPRVKCELDSMTLVRRLIQEYKIAVIPGSAFGITSGCHLRVAYGALNSFDADDAISRLAKGLRQIVEKPTTS